MYVWILGASPYNMVASGQPSPMMSPNTPTSDMGGPYNMAMNGGDSYPSLPSQVSQFM